MPVLLQSGRFAGGGGADSFIGVTHLATDLTAYPFSGVDIGIAAADRVVVAGVIPSAGGARTISSVTIGGNAMTETTQASGGSQGHTCGIFHRLHATGDTDNFVVTLSAAATSCALVIWTIYPASVTPLDAFSDVVTAGTGLVFTNVSVATGGFLVGLVFKRNGNLVNVPTWNGSDPVSSDDTPAIGDSGFTARMFHISCNETIPTNDMTVGWTGTVNGCGSVASWGA